MVFWEITLGAAYFLGLKKSYKVALKLQRRVVSPKHPKIRQFLHRRTRAVFDVAIRVHRNVQERDIEVGRNLGNWILRCLDRIKPSAQIRVHPNEKPPDIPSTGNMNITKQPNTTTTTTTHHTKTPKSTTKSESDRHLFVSSPNIWHKPLSSITMMMRPPRLSGTMTQYRHFSFGQSDMLTSRNLKGWSFEGGIRKDILQWMVQK